MEAVDERGSDEEDDVEVDAQVKSFDQRAEPDISGKDPQ